MMEKPYAQSRSRGLWLGRALLVLLGFSVGNKLAHADTLSLVTSPALLGANAFVAWGQLGADGAPIPHSFNATSSAADPINGLFSTTTGLVALVGGSWGPASGAFTAGDFLVWAFDNGSSNGTGPVTFTFPSGFGAGAAIQPDSPGQFTAKLELFNGATSLGFKTEQSDIAGDAMFIGVLDTTGPNVTKAVFSLTAVGSNPNNETNNAGDFALDTLSLHDNVSTVPEPSMVVLLTGALVGLYCKLRRRAN